MKSFKAYIVEKLKELKPINHHVLHSRELDSFDNPRYNIVGGRHRYVYHGTTMKDAENIMKRGIGGEGISFTGNPHEGRGYAVNRGTQNKTDGALIRIDKKYLKLGKSDPNDMPTAQNIKFKGRIPRGAIELVGKYTFKK